ncbi:DUF2878 family protein [Kaarinaea lacus]
MHYKLMNQAYLLLDMQWFIDKKMNINRQFIFDAPSHAALANTMAWLKAISNLGLLMVGIGICFYSAISAKYIAGGFAVLSLLILHLTSTQDRFAEASVIILVGIVGGVVEVINTTLGLYEYATPAFNYAILPTWIVSIWFIIGATVRHTFRWLSRQLPAAGFMGIILGSLTYYVAAKLGVIHLAGAYDNFAITASLSWAAAFPVIVLIGHRLMPFNSAKP